MERDEKLVQLVECLGHPALLSGGHGNVESFLRGIEVVQNAASGDIRKRSERGIEAGLGVLCHVVKHVDMRTDPMHETFERFKQRDLDHRL
jgi:hypothetical protein